MDPCSIRLPASPTSSRSAACTVKVRRRCTASNPAPDGRLGYVSCVVSSTVDVIDLETLERLARLDIARLAEPGAHGLAYVSRPA
ncbi:hypothetical protein [Streptomyces sp. NPDC001389]|uniref:hypothetical protein n=1 Tax=unclassified Streptomyces TaxID=2593676 RepID=UPI0036801BBC